MSPAAKPARPNDSASLPTLDELKQLPPLALGMFGAGLVAFGIVAMQQSAKMLSAKSPSAFARSLIVRTPTR